MKGKGVIAFGVLLMATGNIAHCNFTLNHIPLVFILVYSKDLLMLLASHQVDPYTTFVWLALVQNEKPK